MSNFCSDENLRMEGHDERLKNHFEDSCDLINPYENAKFEVSKGGFFSFGPCEGVIKSADAETGKVKCELQSNNPHLDGQQMTMNITKEAAKELIEFLPYLGKTEEKK